MKKVLSAYENHHAKLVFFDKMYMYDFQQIGHMTESIPIRPYSRKGEVRDGIYRMLKDAIEAGKFIALVAGSCDFW